MRQLRTETCNPYLRFQICVLLVPVYLEILKSSDFLKNKVKSRTVESRTLMPSFHMLSYILGKGTFNLFAESLKT